MTTLASLRPDADNGRTATITFDGKTMRGRLIHAQSSTYRRTAVRHWFLAVPSRSIHFREDAVSLQWAPSDAEITFESERAA